MPKCSFCSKTYEFPQGLTLVLNDGTILYFCSGKCRKNWKMGRKSKKLGWTMREKKTRAELLEEIKQEKEEEQSEKEAKAEIEKGTKEKKAETKSESKKE